MKRFLDSFTCHSRGSGNPFLMLLFLLSLKAHGFEQYDLSSEQYLSYQKLTQELRCVVCQNESLAESNATLAQQLRHKIATQLQEGKSEQEITQYLSARFGEFIFLQPTLSPKNWLLWAAPFLLLLIGGWQILRMSARR